MTIEYYLLIGSSLILVSATITKISENLGVPSLLLFLAIGIIAGTEGFSGIEFNNARLPQSIGIIALIYILFAGGLDTSWPSVRPVAAEAISLSTLGVLLTAVLVAVFAVYLLGLSLYSGLLLGAIISSTDAAAVFSVLRSRNVSLRGLLKPLLELESGSNDPMAAFLTIGVIGLIASPNDSVVSLVWLFLFQMGLGAGIGFGMGKLMVIAINKLRSPYEGIYPVFAVACAACIYGATTVLGGSGFLAVYLAGLVVGNSHLIQHRSLVRFFDGLAWLSQISMFLVLGLLVVPSHLIAVMGTGFLASAFLMLVARPVSVFVSLSVSSLAWREKCLVSWVGLRGAVPIILATFPLLAGLPEAEFLFSLVFFIVLTSATLQGMSIPAIARLLRVDAPAARKPRPPLEFAPPVGADTDLVDLTVPFNAAAVGKSIVELDLPADSLIVLINRNEDFLVPSGGTLLEEGDMLLVLVNKKNIQRVREILSEQKTTGDGEASGVAPR